MASPFWNSEPSDVEEIPLPRPRWSSPSSQSVLTYKRSKKRFTVKKGRILDIVTTVTVRTEHGTYEVTRNSNGEYTITEI